MQPLEGKRVLLGVSGGIAAYKAVEILRGLQRQGAEVRVAMTKSATRFVSPLTFEALSHSPVHSSLFPENGSGEVIHVSLGSWPDLILVAPATANIIAKMAHGLSDDLVSCTLLASRAAVVVAPAMETQMYHHPALQKNLVSLRERGVQIIEPEAGELASGDVGIGRLAEPERIVEAICQAMSSTEEFRGKRILVTAGRTEEDIDPVRFITNRSTGKMGYAVAERARKRGAEVVLVSGPSQLDVPPCTEFVPVRTVSEMHRATAAAFETADALVMTAAVLDFRPDTVSQKKIKKCDSGLALNLVPNHDFLVDLGTKKQSRLVVGFAMETENGISNARKKLVDKHLDLIVLNDLTIAGAGFGVDTNVVSFLEASGEPVNLPKMSKLEVADRILDRLAQFWLGDESSDGQ